MISYVTQRWFPVLTVTLLCSIGPRVTLKASTERLFNHGEEAPPFTPEQLAWIDRLIVGRRDQAGMADGDITGPGTSTSAGATLTTAASTSGKRACSSG